MCLILPALLAVTAHLSAHGEGKHYLGRTQLELGGEYTSFKFEEHDEDGANIMTEKGCLAGLRAALIHRSPLYWRINGSYRRGNLEYDGATQAGTPVVTDTSDTLFDVEAVLGTDLAADDPNTVIAFYSGLGFRRWENEITGPGGYPRRTDYLYLPVGLEFDGPLGRRGWWGLRGQLDLLVRGMVRSDFSEISPELGEIKNTQSSGYGIRASFFVHLRVGRSSALSIEPFMQYWQIDASDVVTLADGSGLYEPANSTTVYGIAVSLLW